MCANKKAPPRLGQWLLKRIVNNDIFYGTIGDFEEIFSQMVKDHSAIKAMGWYWLQVIKSFPSYLIDSIY